MNTGEINGVVKRLEASVGKNILQLACRHHIYELVCGAASEIVLGKNEPGKEKKKTTAPYEPVFKKFCNSWEYIDKDTKYAFDTNSANRTLQGHIADSKTFLTRWLKNPKTMRDDYLEMAQLCLIYLGGTLPNEMSDARLRAPSAYHHARWMSKILYVLKIAMLKPHFIVNIEEIRSLALFYSVYYSTAWLTCTFATDAPLNDLNCIKTLEVVWNSEVTWPIMFKQIVKAALDKLLGHTWYLSERLVILALFSKNVDTPTKERMRRAILKYMDKPQHNEQLKPECTSFSKKQLKDFVGSDSHCIFDLLDLKKDFLKISASKWTSSINYMDAVNSVKQLSVVNDAAERALGMATSLHGPAMPKDETQKQSLFKVVTAIRKVQGSAATSSERVTKKGLPQLFKSCITTT